MQTWLREEKGPFANLVEYIRMLCGPWLALLLPLTVYYWRDISKTQRALSVSAILFHASTYLATGTNKGLFDLLLIIPSVMLAAHFSGRYRVRFEKKIVAIVLVSLLSAFAIWFFTKGQYNRPGHPGVIPIVYSKLGMQADVSNPFIRYIPGELKYGLIALSNYLTQGYYGLYLSLEQPFVASYGIGHSAFLLRNVATLTGTPSLMDRPYPFRIEPYGWHPFINWHTIYPWLASDVSFPGTIIIVFFIGRLAAAAWLDSIRGANPFALGALAQFVIMLFYFPANNQTLQTGEAWMSFWGLLLLWKTTRRKIVFGQVRRGL
ncbi:MAG: hypothetical protein GX037_03190 [Trueperella sp.]|nr:hypothetical protein [Trueperella sp.]